LLGHRLGSAQAAKRHARAGGKQAAGSGRTGRAREEQRGPQRKIGLPGQKRGREVNFFFFFLFKYFKAFSNDFESYFEFESNHSLQKFKSNSMSAQTCFYPYI
jgi:hypothetical protein